MSMQNSTTNTILSFVSLMRIEQWLKNLFVFLPMFFNRELMFVDSFFNASIAFISFSFIASSVYCFNDIIDVELDKKHIQKRKRPIASGEIKPKQAGVFAVILVFSGLFLSYILNSVSLTYVLLVYVVLNIMYSVKLKNIIIIDVVLIAISFFLRILAGGVATNTKLSYWIIIMVILLALFLAFAKRRDEVIVFEETNIKVRKNIANYSIKMLNTLLITVAVLIIGFYFLYTFSEEVVKQFNSHYVYLTSPFVISGILRYLYLIKKRILYANPTQILIKDHIMKLIVLGWIVSFYIIIYL